MRNHSSRSKLRVALSFPSGIALSERIQQGIASYARQRGGWNISHHPEMIGTSVTWLRDWHGDGAFIFAITDKECKIARSLHIPVLNLASHVARPGLPTVSPDHYEIGRLAAEHLLSKNFRRLAFYGTTGLHYSNERLRGFIETARNRATLDQLLVPLPSRVPFHWRNQETALDLWLKKLARPVGIFAGTDLRAGIVLDACERLAIKVPREIAVLGVDNDPLVCELREPSLSSVSRNDFEVGRQAAILLEKLIRRRAHSDHWVLVAPDGIVARQSTCTIAVDDPLITEAISHIQSRIGRPFGAEEIAREVPLSRRRFEARFCQAVGRSPYAFINNLRVERAKSLLENHPRLPLTEIAKACGFSGPRRFRLVFQRTTGLPPRQWPNAPLLERQSRKLRQTA